MSINDSKMFLSLKNEYLYILPGYPFSMKDGNEYQTVKKTSGPMGVLRSSFFLFWDKY